MKHRGDSPLSKAELWLLAGIVGLFFITALILGLR